MTRDENAELEQLADELDNFESIARNLLPQPGDVPRLHGIDVYGGTRALNGDIGGDHIIYIDFTQRFDLAARIADALAQGHREIVTHLRHCQQSAGIALIDVSGHRITDALLAAMLHQAFLVGATYELDMSGHITKRLFESLNTRFYKSSGAHKFLSLIYGEISEDAQFRFLSAGQPHPLVFSAAHDRFMDVSVVSFPPLGILPSLGMIDGGRTESPMGFADRYELNDWALMGAGDILLLYTDGLAEHGSASEPFVPAQLEQTLRRQKHHSARVIYEAIIEDVLVFGEPADDLSVVVIKR